MGKDRVALAAPARSASDGCCVPSLALRAGSAGRRFFREATMGVVLALACAVLIVLVLLDGFESMILPRRVNRFLRLTRIYYKSVWGVWRAAARLFPPTKR